MDYLYSFFGFVATAARMKNGTQGTCVPLRPVGRPRQLILP